MIRPFDLASRRIRRQLPTLLTAPDFEPTPGISGVAIPALSPRGIELQGMTAGTNGYFKITSNQPWAPLSMWLLNWQSGGSRVQAPSPPPISCVRFSGTREPSPIILDVPWWSTEGAMALNPAPARMDSRAPTSTSCGSAVDDAGHCPVIPKRGSTPEGDFTGLNRPPSPNRRPSVWAHRSLPWWLGCTPIPIVCEARRARLIPDGPNHGPIHACV